MFLFQELKWRNFIQDCSNEKELEELLNHGKINFYCGIDPSASSLTLGHLVLIIAILLLHKKGHNPFILIGTSTGLIGDPKETSERKLLSNKDIKYNSRKIKHQLKNMLSTDNKVNFVDNYTWISKLDVITFLRTYGKLFNVNYMLSKELVSKRLKKGISYTEFSYMILQALDFYRLYEDKNVVLQLGGSDQWGNITSGLELIRKLSNPHKNNKAVGMSIPLLLNSQGVKFGKSEKNNLWLDEKLTSPYETYQFLVNIPDQCVINYLKKITLLKPNEIMELEKEITFNPKQRIAQKTLAANVVIFLYGKEKYEECFRISKILFYKDKQVINKNDFQLLKKHISFFETKNNISLINALIKTKLTSSKKESKLLILCGSIKIFGQVIKQTDVYLTKQETLLNKYILLTKKNKFHALIILK
ncbi:tyrosine--tRNA ligase [Candidatus Phytoplasma melaleucae]|uniref:Tyrosine--tRNA ligase n=1 Tax=Candidatus Phytoplasma melaleucae TaxID=2982630 RepID=A0ABT9DDR4_9MOLU|nr:tyrosine--tRNA ligase ['Melaleuca sp.' phytoplasma]MDO8168165.1 tyrosine--tRNA ligase ['Melaleuca sp.' phytoplasma]